MKNIATLSQDLSKLYEEIRAGSIDLKMAGELNNTAGKILKAHQVQLAYHALRGEAPEIPFLAAPAAAKAKKELPARLADPEDGALGAMSIPDFISRYKVGRTVVYALIDSGELATYKVGRRRYVSEASARAWLAKREAAQ